MSKIFGEIRQIAFIVRDIDKSLRYWIGTLGIGPFYVLRNFVPDDYRYRGKSSQAPNMTVAFGYSGGVQIELIQQHDDNPSTYRDFLLDGKEGFQHVSSWTTKAEYDQVVAAAKSRGITPIHEGSVPGSSMRFAYFDTDREPGGLIYEISDIKSTPFYDFMLRIQEAARNWDGSDPIREGLPNA